MLGAGEGRAWPAESLGEQRKPASILKAISCFVSRAPDSPTLPLVRVGTGSTGQTRGTQEDRPGSPQPSVHLPASPSLGTENYLCLQIAFDSHELFLLPANRSGDGRGLSSRRAEKSDGGRGAEAEVTSLRIWSQLCHRRAVPSPPLPRAWFAYLQKERVGWPENSAIPCSRDPQRGPYERGTSSLAAHDLSMAVALPLCLRAKASPGPARQEAPGLWRAAEVFPLFVRLHAGP